MKQFTTLFWVLLGNAIYALAVALFLLPSGLITGGTTGIALALNHYTQFPVSDFVLIFNVCMLLLGYIILGRKFAMTTIVSTFAYPLFLKLFEAVFADTILTNDLLLCTVFCGLGIGFALGIVIKTGASTGGMDIPPLVLHHFFNIPVSGSMWTFDILILLAQALYNPTENILYGIILIFIYTIILDKTLLIGTTRIEVKIVSSKEEEIRSAILHQIDRGVTILHGQGGYLRKDTEIVLSVISNRELPKVEKLIHEIDPEAFIIISQVKEVTGRGFSMKKKYQ